MSTFHPAASSLAKFNDTISSRLRRLFIYTSQLFSSRQEPTFVMASQLTLFGDEHQVNTEKLHQRTKEASRFGCGQFLPFITKRILGIKRIFPCGFGNKRIHMYTVYVASFPGLPRFRSSVCVQYNTRRWKSAKNGKGLVSSIT